VTGASNQIHVAAAFADCSSVGRSGVGGVEVTHFNALLYHRQQQVASLRALAGLIAEQPFGTAKPAGRPARLAAKEQTQAQPEGAANRADTLPGIQMSVVCAFERAQVFIVPPDQVCRHGKQFEIIGLQWTFLIGE
jgi:hypothetical protein